jgi:hypothetical protein
MYLMGVHLTDVYFMDVYIPNLPLYERWSIYRDLSCKIRVFALQGLGASDCKRGIARTRRKPKTADRLTTICGWAFQSMLELASTWRVPNFSLATGCGRANCGWLRVVLPSGQEQGRFSPILVANAVIAV